MEEKYPVGRARETCMACERLVAPGEEMVSALIFNGVEFERKDWCVACWEGVRQEDLYSFWRAVVPEKEEQPRARTVNVSVLRDLFLRLAEEKDPSKEAITFLIGMILVQKRVLKFRSVRTEKKKRIVVLGKPRSRTVYPVVDPELDADQMERMREELRQILDQE